MPLHNGLLPREGFTADVLFRLLGKTAFNPALLFPLLLLARLTKRGEDLSILHPTAYRRLKTLFYLSAARWLNAYHSRRVVNNKVSDIYTWPVEVAVVTGGSGGIGGHVAQLLAEHGLKVVVLDIQPLTYTAPANLHFYTCDITSPSTLAGVAVAIRKEVGTPTILINNAGVARGKTVLDSSERDVRFTFDVNALAHFWTAREFLPAMVRSDHGMVVTVASFASWVTAPNMVDYGASKAAAQAFHEGLAAELVTRYHAPRVRTVLVNQGYTRTALFEGYANDSRFVAPTLHPATVADAIVRQVLRGESGQVVVPGLGNLLSGIAGWPLWVQHGMRAKYQSLMVGFRGRQVVTDLEGFYAKREREERERKEEKEAGKGAEESAVLVAEVKIDG
ncbi:dehydrogenase/reductase SDR family member 8 [Coniochaeta sp. PMI_546]|nr:dehydrogenase/reductase SDR family member 8 [Coniochaeta sp. PMI_546]